MCAKQPIPRVAARPADFGAVVTPFVSALLSVELAEVRWLAPEWQAGAVGAGAGLVVLASGRADVLTTVFRSHRAARWFWDDGTAYRPA